MSGFHICDLSIGKESLDSRNSIRGYVTGLGAADEERRSAVLDIIRLPEREISHIIKRVTDDLERDTEFERFVIFLGANEVGQQKLADWKGL